MIVQILRMVYSIKRGVYMRKTKIICTIGPATETVEVLRDMILAGMDVARLNFSHGDHDYKTALIGKLCGLRDELCAPLALLADTKGPEVRLGAIPGGPVHLSQGQEFTLTASECEGDASRAQVSYPGLARDVSAGSRILLDDGLIDLRVARVDGPDIVCIVMNSGAVSSRKSVNIPGVTLNLPYISPQDRNDLRYIASQPFSYIAASFARRAEDIEEIREELKSRGRGDIKIIAKIENGEGLQNIESIMETADGVMVARGDLGVEVPLEDLPAIQKQLIKDASWHGITVITATQMLESMVNNPRPTRAEVSDVANAVYDGTSAIMLSGETAMGAYPVEACRIMAQIAEKSEADIDYRKRFYIRRDKPHEDNVTNAVANAAVNTAYSLKCAAILTMTVSGNTARHISKFHPATPIIACTPSKTTYRQLALLWGVTPLEIPECDSTDALTAASVSAAVKANLLREGDVVAVTAGIPLGQSGATNYLNVHTVGRDSH